MLISGSNRMSRLSACLEAAHHFLLSEKTVAAILEHQISVIGENWSSVCHEADLTEIVRALLWVGSSVPEPFCFRRYSARICRICEGSRRRAEAFSE